MAFALYTFPAGERSFKKLPRSVRKHILSELQVLCENPFTGYPLKGKLKDFYSFHLKYKNIAYRVVYKVETASQSIVIYYASTRENFYKNLEQALF